LHHKSYYHGACCACSLAGIFGQQPPDHACHGCQQKQHEQPTSTGHCCQSSTATVRHTHGKASHAHFCGACTLASATGWQPPERRLLATHTVTAASNRGMSAVALCYTTTCQNGYTAQTPKVTPSLILDLLSVVSACIAMSVLCILLVYPPSHCAMLRNNTPEQAHSSNTQLNMHQTSQPLQKGGRRWLAHGRPARYLRQSFW
jgi:hypothetical protein